MFIMQLVGMEHILGVRKQYPKTQAGVVIVAASVLLISITVLRRLVIITVVGAPVLSFCNLFPTLY